MSRGGRGDSERGGPPNIDGMVTLKVDNIAYNCSVDELREVFERSGKLGDVYIPRDMRTGDPRGFAFVRYLDQRDADDAMDRLDGERLNGRELRIQVKERRERRSRSASPAEARSRGRRSRSRSGERGGGGGDRDRSDKDERNGGDRKSHRDDDGGRAEGRGGRGAPRHGGDDDRSPALSDA
eukprot:g3167.t1